VTPARSLAALVLVVACATTPPPPPPAVHREPEPQAQVQLVDASADHSEWLDLPGYHDGVIGGDTGTASEWVRFQVKYAGKLSVTLSLDRGEAVGFYLYDSSVVDRKDRVQSFGSRVVLDQAQTMTLDVKPGLYYVKVFCESTAGNTEYTLEASLVASPSPPPPPPLEQSIKAAQPLPKDGTVNVTLGKGERFSARWYTIDVAKPSVLTWRVQPKSGSLTLRIQNHAGKVFVDTTTSQKKSDRVNVAEGRYYVRLATTPTRSASATFSATVTASAPPPPPPPPVPPRKPVPLAEPAASSAITIKSGNAVTLIGGDSGRRWVWYRVPLSANSNVRVTATIDGAQATIQLRDQDARTIKASSQSGGAIDANFRSDAAYIRVGPTVGDAASRISINVKVTKSSNDATHTERN